MRFLAKHWEAMLMTTAFGYITIHIIVALVRGTLP